MRPMLAVVVLLASAAAAFAKPNVVVFLADDAGWGDYRGNGNRQAPTPHIDSLAARGVTLERFYVCPVCSPTRAEFLTGRYHPRVGVRGVSTGEERLNLDERTLADAFRAAGYATGAFGKWHNGTQWPYHPQARGFDEYVGHTSGHWGEYFDPPLEEGGRLVQAKGYIVDVCTDRALDFIERHHAQPFFCFIPFTTPHSPWAVPDENWNRWKDREITQRAEQADQENLDQTRCVLAMLENQDANVGRVLKKLDELRLADDTLVVYFSDNGPNTTRWNGGMRGRKGSVDEGGVRSPCFIRWPAKLPAGGKVSQITAAIDLLPTLMSLVGIERVGDKPLDGRDLSPLLQGEKVDWPERMIFSTWANKVSVRSERYRLDERGRLYDMQTDPGQKADVAEREPEIAERLQNAVNAWRKEVFPAQIAPRPFTVGYREFPITLLPARDGEPRGGVRRSANAPNSSYFVNWKTKDDALVWKIDVAAAGRYAVTIDYTCPEADAGSRVELSAGDSRLTGRVQPGWDPPLFTHQDTLPRPAAESKMKEFRPLALGRITLARGPAELTLKAVEIPGASVMDVRRLTLTLLPE